MFDGEIFGQQMVEIVRGYVDAELAPLRAENLSLKERVAVLEARPLPEKGEKGDPGENGADAVALEPAALAAAFQPIAEGLVAAEVAKAVAEIPPAKDGKSVEIDELLPVISDEVAKAVAALPLPKDGEPGKDGKSIEVGDVLPLIVDQVAKAVSEIPVPKDGEPGKDGQDGKDGRGVRELLIDRAGDLIATMDDGTTKNLGTIIGKDGEPGKDGRDGFSLEDFDACVLEDDRTLQLAFRSGEHEHVATLKWPTMIYREVYKAGQSYEAGDAVTWAGSLWVAQKETDAKPDTADSGWKLAVKKGRDGKDARG